MCGNYEEKENKLLVRSICLPWSFFTTPGVSEAPVIAPGNLQELAFGGSGARGGEAQVEPTSSENLGSLSIGTKASIQPQNLDRVLWQ